MLNFLRENSDKLFLFGVALIILGVAVFFGATPRGQKMNGIGEAWMLAVPLILAGALLLIFDWHLRR